MRIFDFINDRSGRVTLTADRGPQDRVEVAAGGLRGRLQARAEDHRHDQRLDEPGAAEKDGAGHDFLEWFCREQVEEEAQAQLIVAQLKLVGDAASGLYLLDQELGKRHGEIERTRTSRLTGYS